MELTLRLIAIVLLLAGSAFVFLFVVETDLGPVRARSILRPRARTPEEPPDTSLKRAA
jgi:hypothetical protein